MFRSGITDAFENCLQYAAVVTMYNTALATMVFSGGWSGLVTESGAGATSVSAIHNQKHLDHATKVVPVAGFHVTGMNYTRILAVLQAYYRLDMEFYEKTY